MLRRQLPRSLDPLPGEGLDGFLLRLSYRLERTPYRMAQLTGLIQPSEQQVVAIGLLMHLPDGRRNEFARATRLSPDEVAGLCLSSMADQYPPASPAPQTRGWAGSLPAGNHWIFKRATRYCPQCLAGDGSAIQNDLGGPWRKTWRLAVVFACLKHTRFLAHLCPGCGHPAHDYMTARGTTKMTTAPMIPQANRPGLHTTQCRLPLASGDLPRRDSPSCGAELSGHPLDPGTILAEPEAIDLQNHINNLLDPSAPSDTVSCGLPAATRRYFIDLRLITHLIRASWPRAQDLLEIPTAASAAISQDHHDQHQHHDRRGTRRTMYDVPPLDAKTCAAVLLTAHRLLQCQQPRLLTEQVRHLLGYDQRPPAEATWTRQILVGKPDCSPGLRHVLAPILQTWTPAPPGRPRRALRTPVRETRYRPEHVPGFLQEDWYQRHFAHIRGINPLHLRRAAAIFLCQIAVGGSFPHAAKLLGTPIARAEQSGRVLCRWARDSTEPRQFETALLDLADELDSAPHLINYQRRRQALNSWSIGPSTWQQLLRQLDPSAVHTAQELGGQGRRVAAISVWARITQGDHPLAWRRSFGSSWIWSQPGRLTHRDAHFQGILDQYADDLATRIDRGEFP
jgi:hypothetical protein